MGLASFLRPLATIVSIITLLMAAGLFSAKMVEKGFHENSKALIIAAERKFLSSEIFRLVLQQDDATKSMIISPDRIGEVSESKISAYDSQNTLMKELAEKGEDSRIKTIIGDLKNLDEGTLRKLDETLLESLLGGQKEEAIKMFFSEYEPARTQYAKTVEKLKDQAEEDATTAYQEIASNIKKTSAIILSTFALISFLFLILFLVNLKRESVQRRNSDLQNLLSITMALVQCKDIGGQLLVLKNQLPLKKKGLAATLWVQGVDASSQESYQLQDALVTSYAGVHETPSTIEVKNTSTLLMPLTLGTTTIGCLTLHFETLPGGINLSFFQSLSLAFALSSQGILDAKKREEDAAVISKKEQDMRLVLDSMSEGLVVVDTQGALTGMCSKAFLEKVGTPTPGKDIATLLYPVASRSKESFAFLFEQLCMDILPFDVGASQLPNRIHVRGATYELTYQPVVVSNQLHNIIVGFRDVTTQVLLEEKDRANRDALAFLELMSTSPEEAHGFLREMRHMVAEIPSSPHLARLIHTMKGSASVVGLGGFAAICHSVEDTILGAGTPDPSHLNPLFTKWAEFENRVAPFLQTDPEDTIRLSKKDGETLLRLANEARSEGGDKHHICSKFIDRLKNAFKTPVEEKIHILKRQAEATATKLGKHIEVQEELEPIRLEKNLYDSFFTSLVHVVRNAIDHGIEDTHTRESRGKSPIGLIKLDVRNGGSHWVLSISDDGGGIPWDAVEVRAKAQGLAAKTHGDLVAALFADGLTTRTEVSSYSGRGVGLSAVMEACTALGGRVDVLSSGTTGTTFTFTFPFSTPEAEA